MKLTMTYVDLAKEIHQNARDKGFWDEERDLEEMLMLAVSELSEGLEEHRDGHELIWFRHHDHCASVRPAEGYIGCSCAAKPEGLAIEIADCLIRCLDTLQHVAGDNLQSLLSVTFKTWINKMPERRSSQLFRITQVIANASPAAFTAPYLAQAVVMSNWMLWDLDIDPMEAIRIKMDYNKTREHKHGKAY